MPAVADRAAHIPVAVNIRAEAYKRLVVENRRVLAADWTNQEAGSSITPSLWTGCTMQKRTGVLAIAVKPTDGAILLATMLAIVNSEC